tara:strand:+ start:66 stop:308 length:243 start_codon:yes stop_codon:yes gene_type:complete
LDYHLPVVVVEEVVVIFQTVKMEDQVVVVMEVIKGMVEMEIHLRLVLLKENLEEMLIIHIVVVVIKVAVVVVLQKEVIRL